MASASDSTRTPTRRAVLAHAVASGYAATLPPVFVMGGSALAGIYDAAAKRFDWVRDPAQPVADWPDERMSAEIDRFSEALETTIREPSRSDQDLAAKARLILSDRYEEAVGDNVSDRALTAFLKEVARRG